MADLTEQVLDHFRERFVKEMDAKAIVMELENHKIISNGDQTEIRRETNSTQQNQLLHACLKKKCTVEALMVVCDVITKVECNSKLQSLGKDMKKKLEKDTSVDSILKEFRDENLSNVNTKECTPELRCRKVIAKDTEIQRQGITASPHSKVSFGRCRVSVTCVVLAMLIPFVGIAVCLLPLPFANDWQHRMCPSGITWPWDWGQSDTCTAAETPASVNSETSTPNQPQPTLTDSGVDTGTDSAAGMDTSSIVQERHTQGSDEDADIHSQMSITETPASANSETSTANQPQPALTDSGVDPGTDSAADLIQVSELHTDLTKEDLRYLQSVGQNDLVWVEIGVTGVGKSTLGNFLLGKDTFKVGSALKSVTKKAEVDCSAVNDQRMCIVDTPGFGDTRRMLTDNTEAENLANDAAHLIVELSKTMLMAQHGINAFFVVVRADSRELFSTMKLLDLLDILGNYWNHSILVFNRGKEFDEASEERQYAEVEAMLKDPSCPDVWKALIGKVSNRYVIVEPEEWKDDKEYRLRKLTEFRKHTSHIAANSGPYNDTLHSLVREYIETAKLELRHEFSDVDSPEAQVAALQVAFTNITSMLYKLIRIKLAGGVDTELLQKMANVKEEQLAEVRKQRELLYEQLLKEQEEKRRAQEKEERAREDERKAKEREMVMAEEKRLALEREEKARKELEEYLKKPTFAERRIETKAHHGFHSWRRVHHADAIDVGTGITAKAENYASKGGAVENAKANLKAILLERGIIRKD